MDNINTLSERTHYQNNTCSFVLRLWSIERAGATNWRASVEIPETGKRIGFASLEQLFAFLIDFTDSNCARLPVNDTD